MGKRDSTFATVQPRFEVWENSLQRPWWLGLGMAQGRNELL